MQFDSFLFYSSVGSSLFFPIYLWIALLLLVAENIFNQIINEVKLINLFHRINEVANRVAFIRRTIRISATFRIRAHSGSAQDGNKLFSVPSFSPNVFCIAFCFLSALVHRLLHSLAVRISAHFVLLLPNFFSILFLLHRFFSKQFSTNMNTNCYIVNFLFSFISILVPFVLFSFVLLLWIELTESHTYVSLLFLLFLLFSFHFIGFLSVHFKLSMLQPSAVGAHSGNNSSHTKSRQSHCLVIWQQQKILKKHWCRKKKLKRERKGRKNGRHGKTFDWPPQTHSTQHTTKLNWRKESQVFVLVFFR